MASASQNNVAIQARTQFGMNILSTMRELNDFEYETWTQWKLDVELTLAMCDLDLALLQPKPPKPTDTSLPEDKAKYDKWERSNHISLLLMKTKMADHVRSFVPQSDNAKQFFAGIEKLVLQFEKRSSQLLYSKLTVKYNGEGNVCEHIFEMCSAANRLRACDVKISDELLLLFVLSSLPSQFDHVIRKFETDKEMKLNDVIAECSYLEKYLRQESKLNINGHKESDDSDVSQQEKRMKRKREIRCYCCGHKGHLRKDCVQ